MKVGIFYGYAQRYSTGGLLTSASQSGFKGKKKQGHFICVVFLVHEVLETRKSR